MLRITVVLAALLSLSLSQQYTEFTKFQWNYLNFTWPSSEVYQNAVNDGSYIPKNNIITGIKVWKDRMYLTVPRFKNGVPATLVSIALNPTDGNMSPLLEPFPNWEMQKLDDCSAFQYVQSMEIDTRGRMWILENGRTEFQTSSPRVKCPARLVIMDLENNNEILLDYEFPKDVVHMNSVFVNDIVLDHEDGGYAYITDADTEYPGIIVFSLKNKTSWKVTHETMKAVEKAKSFVVNGTTVSISGATDGIALSPASTEGNRVLYYTPLSSYHLYSVPVNQLKENNLKDVTTIAEKTSQTDGMFMNSAGYLYYGLLGEDTVAIWNTDLKFEEHIHYQHPALNQWPDTFAMDTDGYLYWTANRLHLFAADKLNINEPNYRVIASKTTARSYQYYKDKTAPPSF